MFAGDTAVCLSLIAHGKPQTSIFRQKSRAAGAYLNFLCLGRPNCFYLLSHSINLSERRISSVMGPPHGVRENSGPGRGGGEVSSSVSFLYLVFLASDHFGLDCAK